MVWREKDKYARMAAHEKIGITAFIFLKAKSITPAGWAIPIVSIPKECFIARQDGEGMRNIKNGRVSVLIF